MTDVTRSTTISLEDYLDHYAAQFYEWVEGDIVKMPPITEEHEVLAIFLRNVFDAYFAITLLGVARNAPFAMRLDPKSVREPDVMVILNDSLDRKTRTALHGPADICIEIVSQESTARDYGEKFEEYEAGGVKEYWILDTLRHVATFHRLDEETGRYVRLVADEDYETPLLPRLKINVPTLFSDKRPDFHAISAMVKAMLGAA